MNQIRQLTLQTVIKNLADNVAIQFHLLSKKCLKVIKRKLENQQYQKFKRREALLTKYRAKTLEKQIRQEQNLNKPNQQLNSKDNEQAEPEESRLARINRIKQAMFNKSFESKPQNQNQKESQQANFGISMEIVFHHFTQELRPQILAKYPSAQPEKVNKVILQKWTNFDSVKREAYIKKIKKKIELLQKKKSQLQDRLPLTEPQICKQMNSQAEVKRQEALEQLQSKKNINQNYISALGEIQIERLQKKQEIGFQLKGEQKQNIIQKQPQMSQMLQFENRVKQKYEPKSGFQ